MLVNVVLLLVLPQDAAVWIFFGWVVLSLLTALIAWMRRFGFDFHEIWRVVAVRPPESQPPTLPKSWQRWAWVIVWVELIVVGAIAWEATREFRVDDPQEALPGGEAEWLTSFAYFAAQTLEEEGRIPLWQPFFEYGEPLIENPFSFIMNPFVTIPSLLYGGAVGIRYSVVLHALIVGYGGWFLGRVLRLGPLGRVLLAALLIGKGNMLVMIGTGYFQLGITQAYFPWIIGGTLALLRAHDKRWPIAVTAVSFTLMFFGGNIWYTLPMLLSMACLAVAHLFFYEEKSINWAALRRLAWGAIFTLGLSAVIFIPIWTQRDYIGGHTPLLTAGDPVNVESVLEQFVDGDLEVYTSGRAPGEAQFYYSFIVPLWFLQLIFILLPPIPPLLYRSRTGQAWRIWVPALLMIVITIAWGVGGNPIIRELYQNIPLLAQWRFVGRALAVASFWIAVLVAIRADTFWQAVAAQAWQYWFRPLRRSFVVLWQVAVLIGFAYISGSAAREVVVQWYTWAGTAPLNRYEPDNTCITWLREAYPDEHLAVYSLGYQVTRTYIENRVRLYNIEADFEALPIDETLSRRFVVRTLPEFALAWTPDERAALREFGYKVVPHSPRPVDKNNCVWRREGALPYAYTASVPRIHAASEPLIAKQVAPIETVERDFDRIRLTVQGSSTQRVVVVQENAYPGWEVYINGERYFPESVGGLLGVILPSEPKQFEVEFFFRPRLVYAGAVVSMITVVGLLFYLLRIDRLLWKRLRTDRTTRP